MLGKDERVTSVLNDGNEIVFVFLFQQQLHEMVDDVDVDISTVVTRYQRLQVQIEMN